MQGPKNLFLFKWRRNLLIIQVIISLFTLLLKKNKMHLLDINL